MKTKYNAIVEQNIKLLNNKIITKDNLKDYSDPDKYTKYEIEIESLSILMAQDGLCSIQKIFEYSENPVNDYILIRKNKFDLLVWPAYAMSINQMRASVFKDRIDYLLDDLDVFYKIIEQEKTLSPSIVFQIWDKCKLARAYIFPNTFYWLCSYENFELFLKKRNLNQFVFNPDKSKIIWPDKYQDYYNKLIEILKNS